MGNEMDVMWNEIWRNLSSKWFCGTSYVTADSDVLDCFTDITFNPLCAIFSEGLKHILTFYVKAPHWHDKNKTITYLFYIVNIMGVDVLATQGARASATTIFTMLNWINSAPARWGLNNYDYKYILPSSGFYNDFEIGAPSSCLIWN